MSVHFVTNEKVAETSSKGNQEKWLDNGRWYKLDQFGYEALAEVFSSMLLEYSNVEKDFPFRFVRYRMERMNVHGRDRVGCSSEDFLKKGESVVTLSHLLKRSLDKPLADVLTRLTSDKKRIAYLADATTEFTGLELFPEYMTILFEIDGLILNDDRHLNNIAVIEKNGRYDYCPIFDNGAGLLSNTQFSPMDIDPKGLMKVLQARPFKTTFNRQVGAVRALYGPQLEMPKFTHSQLQEMLEPMLSFYAQRDRSYIADRVCEVILQRQRNY